MSSDQPGTDVKATLAYIGIVVMVVVCAAAMLLTLYSAFTEYVVPAMASSPSPTPTVTVTATPAPAPTVTATATATKRVPVPGPTVTHKVSVPGPTVTVTRASSGASRSMTRPRVHTLAVSGDPRSVGRALAAERGWTGAQWDCLDALWSKESGWRVSAANAYSGAYGIPQALPGSKMASAGGDWRTSAATQVRWGLDYIGARYGTPCGAWAHSQARNWY